MVSRKELERIARRHRTLMARAMLRALGALPASRDERTDKRYRAMLWCFENHGSPMDRSL